MKERIEIPLSKYKIVLAIGGSILFVFLGVWLVTHSNDFQSTSLSILRNPIVIKSVGIIAILFFGATGTYAFKKLFDKKLGLILDRNGITDNSNASSIGLIEWNDISAIKTRQVMSTQFLLIYVINPEKYIGKGNSKLKIRLMRYNMKMYGTPISITANTLKYSFVKLEQLVQSTFKKHK